MRLTPIQIAPAKDVNELQTKLIFAVNQLIDSLNIASNPQLDGRGSRVINVASPSISSDAVNVSYLDEKIKRLPVIERRVSALENITAPTVVSNTNTAIYSTATAIGTLTTTTWIDVPGCITTLTSTGTWAIDGILCFLKGVNDTELQGRLEVDGGGLSPLIRWSTPVTITSLVNVSQQWLITNTDTSTLKLQAQKVAGSLGASYTDSTNSNLRAIFLST